MLLLFVIQSKTECSTNSWVISKLLSDAAAAFAKSELHTGTYIRTWTPINLLFFCRQSSFQVRQWGPRWNKRQVG
jgi:hypothetical protein